MALTKEDIHTISKLMREVMEPIVKEYATREAQHEARRLIYGSLAEELRRVVHETVRERVFITTQVEVK